MKITHLHIENFRSIHSLDLTLDDATVFIGPDNAGKLPFLKLFALYYRGTGAGKERDLPKTSR